MESKGLNAEGRTISFVSLFSLSLEKFIKKEKNYLNHNKCTPTLVNAFLAQSGYVLSGNNLNINSLINAGRES